MLQSIGSQNRIQFSKRTTTKVWVGMTEAEIVYMYTNENDMRVSVKVPAVTGLTIEEARAKLKQSNLNIKIEGEDGIVVSQEPQADKSVEEGSLVDVVVQKKEGE